MVTPDCAGSFLPPWPACNLNFQSVGRTRCEGCGGGKQRGTTKGGGDRRPLGLHVEVDDRSPQHLHPKSPGLRQVRMRRRRPASFPDRTVSRKEPVMTRKAFACIPVRGLATMTLDAGTVRNSCSLLQDAHISRRRSVSSPLHRGVIALISERSTYAEFCGHDLAPYQGTIIDRRHFLLGRCSVRARVHAIGPTRSDRDRALRFPALAVRAMGPPMPCGCRRGHRATSQINRIKASPGALLGSPRHYG